MESRLYEWWQLFDTATSRYYYYNISTQRTVWHLPNDQTSSTSLAAHTPSSPPPAPMPLASRLLALLIKNHSLLASKTTNDMRILHDNIRRAESNDRVGVETTSDQQLRLFLRKNAGLIENALCGKSGSCEDVSLGCLKSKVMVSVPLSAAVAATPPKRRLLPRTNPNYVNVDLIDVNNGRTTVKNTYVKLQELSAALHDESSAASCQRRGAVVASASAASDLYQQATLMLLSILKSTEKGKTIGFDKQSAIFLLPVFSD